MSCTKANNNAVDRLVGKKSPVGYRRELAVLLFFVLSLLSMSVLAKYSFAMPRTSASHWICKTCKIQNSQGATPVGGTVLQAIAKVVRGKLPRLAVVARRDSSRSRAPTSGFFPHSSLRAPPSA